MSQASEPATDREPAGPFFVFFGQGECKRVERIDDAREMRDGLREDGDYAVILDRDNREIR